MVKLKVVFKEDETKKNDILLQGKVNEIDDFYLTVHDKNIKITKLNEVIEEVKNRIFEGYGITIQDKDIEFIHM